MPSGRLKKPPTVQAVSKEMPPSFANKPVAQEKWANIMGQLGDKDLTALSRDHAVRYCDIYQLYTQALEKAEQEGVVITSANGYIRQNPACNLVCLFSDRLRRIAIDLGLEEEAMQGVDSTSKWKGLVIGA